MNRIQRLFAGAALCAVGQFVGAAAWAQSTGTTQVDELVVRAVRGPKTIGGAIIAETAPKSRSSVTQQYISLQPAGQTILSTLNLVPGLNFTNDDPYGSSGGNVRLRGQDGNHIGLLIDGVPLNDAGNYAIYTNQQLDPELIEQANVNTGTTDVDTVTASSTAGIINYTTLKTTHKPQLIVSPSVGSYDYRRVSGLYQTGDFGPWNTSAWIQGSYQKYNKFKGPGDLQKKQFNFRVTQPLPKDGDFISITGNYNENRNTFYYNSNLSTSTGYCDVAMTLPCPSEVSQLGWSVDYFPNFIATPGGPGAQTVPSQNSAVRGYYGIRINPSNTGTLRGSSRFTLTPNLHLTVDPDFNYTLANGGGTTSASESDGKLQGSSATFPSCAVGQKGVDLNGDGDCLDTVQVYSPSNTHTHRYGVNSSLIWDVAPGQVLRIAYALDRANTRQTGEWSLLDANGNPINVFSGLQGDGGTPVRSADGTVIEKRNRVSIATDNQFSLEYRGQFFDKKLSIDAGLRQPNLKRELHQFCYTQQSNTGTVYCTSQTPSAPALDGTVTFPTSGTKYYQPFSTTRSYSKTLPNVGAAWRIDDRNIVFAAYAEELSPPKVDNLYNLKSDGTIDPVQSETSATYELGYRYQSSRVLGSVVGWHTKVKNRIVSTRDPLDDSIIDRNVGDVDMYGLDGQIGGKVGEHLNLYGSLSYVHTALQSDLFISAGKIALTKGKQLVETPPWMVGVHGDYKIGDVTLGLNGKWVDKRWVTDVNDLSVPSYTVWDASARWDMDKLGWKNTYLQVNATNIFNAHYNGSLKGTTTSATPGAPGYGRPYAAVAPFRAVQATLRMRFF